MLAKRKEEFALYEEEQLMLEPAAQPKPMINKKLRAKCAVFVLLFAGLAMFTTIRSETIVSEGYALVQAKSQTAQIEKENERLRLEIAQMKAPQRIEEIAVTDLGMIVPKEVYFASKNGE